MKRLFLILGIGVLTVQAQAAEVQATLYRLTQTGQGEKVGTIIFKDTFNGLSVSEKFANLPSGAHGIHVHENGDCSAGIVNGKMVLGAGAGGHYDPAKTGKHLGPAGGGHKGDLPVLNVQSNGTAEDTFYLHGLNAQDLKGRAVIIHENGDNYADQPSPLGGGGDRIACGVIE